jgi:ABC-type iron transport system FetAB ATPase subunit
MTAARLRIEALRSPLVGPFALSVAAGECVGISGASGAGKSLFLRMIADLDPNEGSAWLDERERGSFTAPAWRRQVMYVPAEPGWWSERVAAHFTDMAAARAMAARLDLKPDLFDGPVLRLSTGERQRLALIRAMLLAPKVLLLDEPTSALDEATRAMTEQLLCEALASGVALLLVSHDRAQAARLGSRQFVMEAGKLRPA